MQTEPEVKLAERGIDETQAADLRGRLRSFAEDWERPEMDAYDVYERGADLFVLTLRFR
jgi:hypothetical protein